MFADRRVVGEYMPEFILIILMVAVLLVDLFVFRSLGPENRTAGAQKQTTTSLSEQQ